MNQEFFKVQWDRLVSRFGDRAMDQELMRLVAIEVGTMSQEAFRHSVDTWIGHRPHTKPPLLAEFREARLAEEKARLSRVARGAVDAMNHPAARDGLKKVLALKYPGCNSLMDAVKVQILRNQIERANRGEA